MVEDIRDLIEKINQDGIRAAEEKARDIEDAARQRADDIIAAARHEAEDLISAAKERIRREDEKERSLLVQAGRDMLLSLREEINAMLGRILVTDIRKSLTPEALSIILAEAVRKYGNEASGDIIIFLSPEDRETLEKNFMARLREETGKKIVVRPSGDMEGIPPTVDWWREIEKGIEEADIFIFLISPESSISSVCGQEIDAAVKNAKRIIPLVDFKSCFEG